MADVLASVREQPRVVALLERSLAQPSHAYLFAGPADSGVAGAARSFAAALVCPDEGCAECSTCRRVLAERHPDVTEIRPEGASYLVAQAAGIIEAAFRSPVESDRKVLILHEAERMRDDASNRLLKTLEEPPEHTVFILVTASPDALLPTVRSRCQIVTLSGDPLDESRAERLAGRLANLVDAFRAVPARIDGTGGAVALLAADLLDAVEGAFGSTKDEHDREEAEVEAEMDAAGYSPRDIQRVLRPLSDRHDRIQRRARADALAEGLAVLEGFYRDALLTPAGIEAADALSALDAVAETRRVLADDTVFNWGLLLESLLLHLPAAPR